MADSNVFRTSKSTRRSELVFFAILLPVMGVLVLLSSLAGPILYWGFGVPLILSALIGVCLPVWFARRAWRALSERLRFEVVLKEDQVQLGRGRSALAMSYDDVELITVKEAEQSLQEGLSQILVQGLRDKGSVYLLTQEAVACADALRERCPNAVYTDIKGNEFFPPDSRRPLRNLLLVERRCFRIAMKCFVAVPFTLAVTYISISALLGLPAGAAAPNYITVGMVSGGFASPILAWQGWRNLRKSREAHQTRMLKQSQGVVDQWRHG